MYSGLPTIFAWAWRIWGSKFLRRAFGREASHIVTVGKLGEGGHGTTDDPLLAEVSAHLSRNRVVHTIRRGMLRFAFHLFNSDDDVERVLDLTREVVRARSA